MSRVVWEDCVNTCDQSNKWMCVPGCPDIINDNKCESNDCYRLTGGTQILTFPINATNYKNIGVLYHYTNYDQCTVIIMYDDDQWPFTQYLLEDGINHSVDTGIIPELQGSSNIQIFVGTARSQSDCTVDSFRVYGTLMESNVTKYPTNTPSNAPVIIHTILTENPTTLPSYLLTHYPTTPPSLNPSVIPTINPSIYPTNIPSDLPTIIRTILTEKPTNIPTNNPTTLPSYLPTDYPTNLPSLFPSVSPSINPSINPGCAGILCVLRYCNFVG